MIIFMGVAGSGKSVQGRMLADALGLPWLSTGEFLRMLIAGDRRKAMLSGQLLEDQEIIALIQKIFSIVDISQEFILDGFPRTAKQADWLLSQVEHGQLKVNALIHLTASEDVVRERLLSRGRPDDYEEAIVERFREYHDAILPILERFKKAGITVHTVSGEKAVKDVHQAIKQVMGR
jgi:adenylate kinase